MTQDRIRQLEFLLYKRNEEIDRLDRELSTAKDEARVTKSELREYKQRSERAYDIHVTTEIEPCCDHEYRVEELEDERNTARLALNQLSFGISKMFPHAAYSPDDPAQNLEIIRIELSRLYAQIKASEATMTIRTDK